MLISAKTKKRALLADKITGDNIYKARIFFDTLSHAMETYFGRPDENNLSDDMGEALMRSVIRNIRVLLADQQNYDARSELAWASAMAENGILKIGKITDFQCRMIEHQLGTYTNCNHGAGLAVLHPVLYRHIYRSNPERFARFARNVWGITEKVSKEKTALAGIRLLEDFIHEIGLPQSFTALLLRRIHGRGAGMGR